MIDLDSALRLAEVENPSMGIASQAIQGTLAEQLAARSMLLPIMRAGMNYHLHNGVLQSSFGEMRQVDSSSLYVGAGAGAVTAGTVVIPGVQIFSQLTDAIFQPLAARQLVNASRARSMVVANETLLQVAVRFLALVRAEAGVKALRTTESEMNRVVEVTAAYARTRQGREADAMRAQGDALLLHVRTQAAEQNVVVAASELSQVLNLDPVVRLRSPAGAIGTIQLVDPKLDLKALIRQALEARPELAALRAEIQRKQVQIRQERLRPFLPTISAGYSAGTFGGTSNLPGTESAFGPRTDLEVIAYWTLQNAGVGNFILQKERRVERDGVVLDQTRMVNQIGREVAEAFALAGAHHERVVIARRRLGTAELAFKEDFDRIRGGRGLSIEVLKSLKLLVRARSNLIEETYAYDVAEFRLFVALGQAPPLGGEPATPAGPRP